MPKTSFLRISIS